MIFSLCYQLIRGNLNLVHRYSQWSLKCEWNLLFCCSLLTCLEQKGTDYSIHWSARRCSRYRINKWGIAGLFSLYSSTLIKSSVTGPTSTSVCCPCIDLCSYTELSSRSWQEVRTLLSSRFFFSDIYSLSVRRHNYLSAANMSMTLLTPAHPASKRRCRHWLRSSLLNYVNNRFDFASVSVLPRSRKVVFAARVKAMFVQWRAESHLHSSITMQIVRVYFRCWTCSGEKAAANPAGTLSPRPSLLRSISLTITSRCCRLLMEHCRDSPRCD